MDDFDIIEDHPLSSLIVPIFNFEYSNKHKSLIDSYESVPSDHEALNDASILEFPALDLTKSIDSELQSASSVVLFSYTLHMLIFRGDFSQIRSLYTSSPDEYNEYLNLIDMHGNTPLMLAAKLSPKSKAHEKIFKFLLSTGADPFIKDSQGWALMDEIVAQKSSNLCYELFEALYKIKLDKWLMHKQVVLEALRKLPEFYMEIRWEFGSSVIPLVGKIAPHDVWRFWKFGASFRIDTSLVGWKNLRSKRRHMSMLFTPKAANTSIDQEIFVINHQKKVMVRPLEPLDEEERQAIVADILGTEPVQGDVKLVSYKVQPCLNWRNREVTAKIGDWKTQKFKVSYKAQMKYIKKGKGVNLRPIKEDEYFDTEIFEPVEVEMSGIGGNEPVRTIVKTSKAYMWLSQSFPFSLQKFLPILEMIGESNSSVKKLCKFLTNENLIQSIPHDSFPVKVDVPLSMSLKAVVTFEKFRILADDTEMQIPKFEQQKRKYAQKILTCPKKRILLANLVI